jgi:hypothetical protein
LGQKVAGAVAEPHPALAEAHAAAAAGAQTVVDDVLELLEMDYHKINLLNPSVKRTTLKLINKPSLKLPIFK